MSRASRSCGLKLFSAPLKFQTGASRASRSCGLKCHRITQISAELLVTSFTLVWIKIADSYVALPDRTDVTSFTLVWIKMRLFMPAEYIPRSRASRSCGLKSCRLVRHLSDNSSRASRSCGLKFRINNIFAQSVCHELHARVD